MGDSILEKLESIVEDSIKPKKCKNWQGFTTVEEFRSYLQENCVGMTRSEIKKEHRGFYKKVHSCGFADEVLPQRVGRWRNLSDKELFDFQREYCQRMKRSEIKQENRQYYKEVYKRGLQEKIFPQKCGPTIEVKIVSVEDIGSFSEFSLKDFRDYYRGNFAGMSRGEVYGAGKIARRFYDKVLAVGITNKVFPPPKKKPNGYLKDFENIQVELEPIINELSGRFPTPKELKEKNYGLYQGINKHHGGLIAVRLQLGYANDELDILKQIVEDMQNE